MEELNNRQIVLLTMFVSFVVSIATGIITVAMLEEAPPTLTQTVNRVVEHTIERVVTGTTTDTSTKQPATVTNITKEVTVYAKEDDLAVAAVAKNAGRIAKIFYSDDAIDASPRAIGFAVSRDGLIATEMHDLLGDSVAKKSYTVVLGGKEYGAKPLENQNIDTQPVYFLKLDDLSASSSVDAVSFGRSDSVKLAQTLLVLGGSDGEGVFKATLSKFNYEAIGKSTQNQILASIETIPAIPANNTGGLVVNLDGQTVGIVIPADAEQVKYSIYPVASILALINTLAKVAP